MGLYWFILIWLILFVDYKSTDPKDAHPWLCPGAKAKTVRKRSLRSVKLPSTNSRPPVIKRGNGRKFLAQNGGHRKLNLLNGSVSIAMFDYQRAEMEVFAESWWKITSIVIDSYRNDDEHSQLYRNDEDHINAKQVSWPTGFDNSVNIVCFTIKNGDIWQSNLTVGFPF